MTTLQVNVRRKLGFVERSIFGGFVEHLGRCIYGGIFDEGSALSDNRGFRRDVLDLLRDEDFGSALAWRELRLELPLDRRGWPDAGPSCPCRITLGRLESNHFGTDEFMAYCAELGAEPYICLNMGTRRPR